VRSEAEEQECVPEGSASHGGKLLPQRETSMGNMRGRKRHSVTVSLQLMLLVLALGKNPTFAK